jgi:hypothetical protein
MYVKQNYTSINYGNWKITNKNKDKFQRKWAFIQLTRALGDVVLMLLLAFE